MPMMPKRVKYRKSQKGRVRGNATRGNYVAFGEYGLQALEPGQISAADDRGGPRRRQPVGQGGRQGLHPHLPPQERHLDPGRDPDGQGQGRGRILGGRRQAGHRPVRARRRERGGGPRHPGPRRLQDARPLPVRHPTDPRRSGPDRNRGPPDEQARRTPRTERRAARPPAAGDPAGPVPPPPPERDRAARGPQRDHQGQAGDRPDQDDPPPPRNRTRTVGARRDPVPCNLFVPREPR